MPSFQTLDEIGQPYFKRDPNSKVEYCTKCGFERQAGHGTTCPSHPLNRKPFGVGSKVWAYGGMYTRHYPYIENVVVTETRVSWVLDDGAKLPKKHGDTTSVVVTSKSRSYRESTRYWLDFEAFADDIWVTNHQHRIIQKLQYSKTVTPAEWRRIADLVDYREEEK